MHISSEFRSEKKQSYMSQTSMRINVETLYGIIGQIFPVHLIYFINHCEYVNLLSFVKKKSESESESILG